MRISAVERQQKRVHRVSIYIDGEFLVGLSEAALLKSGLRAGQEITEQQKAELLELADYDMAREKVLSLLARRPRSQWEMQTYLQRKAYNVSVINTLLGELRRRGYVDDGAFAEWWIQQRRLLKSISKNKLKMELRQKRIADDIIDGVLAKDVTPDVETIKELIAKKQQQSRYRDRQKLMQYLARQGFHYGDIKDALEESDD